MSNLCQKTTKIDKKRPHGVKYVLEIAKTNFLNIGRVKHNDRTYLHQPLILDHAYKL